MSIDTKSAPTKAQMQAAIAQTLALPFAYNAPVGVLDFKVDDTGKISGRFKDSARPRVFDFELDGNTVNFKPYAPGRVDSVDMVEQWEEFSSGYSYRVDAGIGGSKKPQCVKPTAYNCGKACINIKNNCKSSPEDSQSQERLEKLKSVGKDYAEATKSTKTPKISEPTKTAKVDPKIEAENPTEKPVEKQAQEKTKTLSIAQVEGLAKKAGVSVLKLEEAAKKAGASDTQLSTIKDGVANYMKAQKMVEPSNVKPAEKEVSKPKAETKKPEPETEKPKPEAKKPEPTNLIGDGTHDGMPKTGREYYDAMIKNGKQITKKEAERIVDSVAEWANDNDEMRGEQKIGKFNQQIEDVATYVKSSTPYKGEIHRGISLPSREEALEWLKGDKDGILDNQSAHASWSSDPKTAKDFSSFGGKGSQSVVIRGMNKTGASVRSLAYYADQDEVVVLKDARHKVKSITEKDGVIYADVEEIDPLPEKNQPNKKKEAKPPKEPKQKTIKKPEENLVPSKVKQNANKEKLIGDGTHEGAPKDAQEYFDMMTKQGYKITMKEAEDLTSSAWYWSAKGSGEIRRSQQKGKPNKEAKDFEKYVSSLTPYKGDVYRGVAFKDKKEAMEWLKGDENGLLDNQSAHASWSSKESVANLFADPKMMHFGKGKTIGVVIKSVNKTGVSIQNLSRFGDKEAEVVVPKNGRHRVKSIKEENGILRVEVEEV